MTHDRRDLTEGGDRRLTGNRRSSPRRSGEERRTNEPTRPLSRTQRRRTRRKSGRRAHDVS